MWCGARLAVWNRILLPQRILFPINKMRCDSTHFVTPVNKLRCDSSTLFVTCSQNCPRQQSALTLCVDSAFGHFSKPIIDRTKLIPSLFIMVERSFPCPLTRTHSPLYRLTPTPLTAFCYPNAFCYPLTKCVTTQRILFPSSTKCVATQRILLPVHKNALRLQRNLLTYVILFIPYIKKNTREYLRNKPNETSIRFVP